MKSLRSFLLVLASLLVVPAAQADIATGINKIRTRGCGGKRGVATPLKPSKGLDEVARIWSRGGRLKEAVARTDYRVVNSSSMRVEGTNDERTILDVLTSNYCATIVDPSYSELGMYQRGDRIWVVVATPFTAPSLEDADDVERQVLALVNRARSQARKCGTLIQPAVPPLVASKQLDDAALAHARDMATHDFFEHRGSDGSLVSDRVTRTGYLWKNVAENIAAGARDPATVVQGWIDSPGHCVNLMGAQYKEMGIGYAIERKSQSGVYWAQVFASPMDKVEPTSQKRKKTAARMPPSDLSHAR
jgi:uncharacterized protein YkwD